MRPCATEEETSAPSAPLQMIDRDGGVVVYAPNQFIFDRVRDQYLSIIENTIRMHSSAFESKKISFALGHPSAVTKPDAAVPQAINRPVKSDNPYPLNPKFSFDQF